MLQIIQAKETIENRFYIKRAEVKVDRTKFAKLYHGPATEINVDNADCGDL